MTALLILAALAVTFEQIAPEKSGITWTHDNAASPEKHLPETVGSGCAFFDYENDGLVDIYLVNSRGPGALYRNMGGGRFADVTRQAGVEGGEFGMGAAAADYDADGQRDLFVTSFGRTLLYRNNGDGSFREVAERAGVAIRGWTTHAVWFDYNNDAKLDLFVSSFVQYDPGENRVCGSQQSGRMHYCIPRIFKPAPSYLFHNNGDGTFTDVSQRTGIAALPGKAFGAVATDINNDGWLDLFVANDTVANFLFLNHGGERFEEIGLLAGVAYTEAGDPRSGMGVDAGDFDGDGWQDLFVANIDQETFSLYRNKKGREFTDDMVEIHKATRLLSGWGLRFFDYDNDADPDLFLANGHPDDLIEQFKPMVTYLEPPVMLANNGGKFT
ncbi:MAG: FG-GAP repeat domain-containing protein, partial [Bryobacteraceae bacterium]